MTSFVPRPLEELADEWPSQLDHISASSVKMAARCPEQWRQRYVLGKKIPPAAVLLQGRADHAAIERSMRQKIDSHVDLPLEEVREFFVHQFETEVELSGGIAEIEVRDAFGIAAKRQRVGEMKRQGQLNVVAYHNIVSPLVQPTTVEERFTMQVPGLPVTVIGYIDLVGQHRGEEVLIDRKGSGKSRTTPEPEWTIQAEVYQLAKPLPHEWHITNTTNARLVLPVGAPKLRVEVGPRARAELQLQQIVAEIGHYMRTYGPDGEWPARGKLHTWACKFCGYQPTCWAWH